MEEKSFNTLPGVDIVDKGFLDKVLNMLLNREYDEELQTVLDKIRSIGFWDIALHDTTDELMRYRSILKLVTKLRSESKPLNVIKESLSSTRVFKEIIDNNKNIILSEDYNEILDLLKMKIKTMLLYKFFSVYNNEFLIRAYSGNILEEKDFNKIMEKVEELYADITFDNTAGESLYSDPNDVEKRFERLLDKIKNPKQNKIISSGIEMLDACFRNLFGFESGHVYIFGGPYGLGKTRLMIYMGSCAFLAGHNVLHVTIENKKEDVEMMYDTRFMQITPEDIYAMMYKITGNDKEAKEYMANLIKEFKENMANFDNELQIKKYRPYKVNAAQIESFIKRKMAKGEKKPDVLIIDHMDIMASNQGYVENMFHKGELITAEIKDLAERLNMVVLVPTQMGREGVKKNKSRESKNENRGNKVVGGEGISRSLAKNELADLVCTMNQDESEAHLSILRLYIDKNRNGLDKIIIPLKFDKALINIEPLDGHTLSNLSEIVRSHAVMLSNRIKKRKEIEQYGKTSEIGQNLFKNEGETLIPTKEIDTKELFETYINENFSYELRQNIEDNNLINILTPNVTYLLDINEFINSIDYIEENIHDLYNDMINTKLYNDLCNFLNL